MKTEIYENYDAFIKREDTKINGVTKEFAERNPEFETENETNTGCWNCSDCSDCSDCSGCSRCSGCFGCYECSNCSSCSSCSRCSDCSDCYECSKCPDGSGLFRYSGVKDSPPYIIPEIKSIHSEVLRATESEGSFSMRYWHTCETTHSRAGWVVHLAGEAGYALEKETSTAFAAAQIYKASSPISVSPTRFCESNEVAMDDIKRCATEESNLKSNE